MKLDDYIFNELQYYEASNDFYKRNEYLTKNVKRCRNELMKMLDNEQNKALKKYNFALFQFNSAEKSEYFAEGFMRGLLAQNINIDSDE